MALEGNVPDVSKKNGPAPAETAAVEKPRKTRGPNKPKAAAGPLAAAGSGAGLPKPENLPFGYLIEILKYVRTTAPELLEKVSK